MVNEKPGVTSFQDPSLLWRLWQMIKGFNARNLEIQKVDLAGKNVIVTGGNNGIGKEAAMSFARWGANVVLACRPTFPPHETSPDVAVEECESAAASAGYSDTKIEWWPCDMADFKSIETFASRWHATGRPLDILANNAGIRKQVGETQRTTYGFEIVHQVNFLSQVYITLKLLPSLQTALAPRVIFTTSNLQFLGRFDLGLANEGVNTYASNKLFLQVWLTELQRRMLLTSKYKHIIVHGVHPGLVDTGFYKPQGAEKPRGWLFTWISWILRYFTSVNAQQGSLAILNAATTKAQPVVGPTQRIDQGNETSGGRYFNRIWEAEPMPQTKHPECRRLVWEYVDKHLGLLDSDEILHDLE